MGAPIRLTIDSEDAAIVGATLRMLGRDNRSPDLTVGARLTRVGEQLTSAVAIENAFAALRDSGMKLEQPPPAEESNFIVEQAQALLLGLRTAGVEPHQVGLMLCVALVFVADAQRNKRAALGLCVDFLQERIGDLEAPQEQAS